MGKIKAVPYKSIDREYNVSKKSGYVLTGIITEREEMCSVTLPANEQEKHIIVFCHGTLSDARHNFTDELTSKLAIEYGLKSYRFNFRFDQSEFETTHRYKYSGYQDDLEDLKDVICSLKLDGYIPWCLFGHSRGANDILIYCSQYHNIMVNNNCESNNHIDHLLDANKIALIAAAPRFNMKNMSRTIFSDDQLNTIQSTGSCIWSTQRGDLIVLKEDLLVTDSIMDMNKVINDIPTHIPIMLLHGTDDELIPVVDASHYKQCRDSIDLTIIDSARHAFRGKKQSKLLLTTTSNWINDQYSRMFSSKDCN